MVGNITNQSMDRSDSEVFRVLQMTGLTLFLGKQNMLSGFSVSKK